MMNNVKSPIPPETVGSAKKKFLLHTIFTTMLLTMNPDIKINSVTGHAILPLLSELARLRIEIFREFPYLYDGSVAYEEKYLRRYAEMPGAVIVLAQCKGQIIGASTGLPLKHADEAFRKPFASYNIPEDAIFYFGESVLQKEYRGCGIGHAFFDHREKHATDSGFTHTTFCAVRRPADHALRPPSYRSLEGFWGKRGYQPIPGYCALLPWKEITSDEEVLNTLDFWIRPLAQ